MVMIFGRRTEIEFKSVQIGCFVIKTKNAVHRVIGLENGDFIHIIFDKNGSIFDVRKAPFEIISKYFERYGLHLECRPNSGEFVFEYEGTRKINRKDRNRIYVRLPISSEYTKVEIYRDKKNDLVLLVPYRD